MKKLRLFPEAEEDKDGVDIDSKRNYILIDEEIARDGDISVMNIDRIPEDWKMTEAYVAKKKPNLVDVGNPRDWNRYAFCSVFKK